MENRKRETGNRKLANQAATQTLTQVRRRFVKIVCRFPVSNFVFPVSHSLEFLPPRL
jgi:hypothetical protein